MAVLLLALAEFQRIGGSWLFFALAFLVPDLSMLGYLAGRRLGAAAYNAAHGYLCPAAVAGSGLLLCIPLALEIALIWTAHVGFDRALGYGLKYVVGFHETHLGRIGKARRRPSRRDGQGAGVPKVNRLR